MLLLFVISFSFISIIEVEVALSVLFLLSRAGRSIYLPKMLYVYWLNYLSKYFSCFCSSFIFFIYNSSYFTSFVRSFILSKNTLWCLVLVDRDVRKVTNFYWVFEMFGNAKEWAEYFFYSNTSGMSSMVIFYYTT